LLVFLLIVVFCPGFPTRKKEHGHERKETGRQGCNCNGIGPWHRQGHRHAAGGRWGCRGGKPYVDSAILAKEVGKPEQVAGYVSFVASDDGDYMTGQSVMIDGGIILV
jgi:NAD(P)-dependent dehydrogenase (short-subunit alcohol dehydrogenase family)